MDRSITSGILSVLSVKVGTSLVSILTIPLIVRLLEPGGYGDYSFLLSVFALLMVLLSSGVTEGVQKYVAESNDDPNWEGRIVGFYFRLAAVLAVLGAVTLLLATRVGFVEQLLGERYRTYFYLLSAYVVTQQFYSLGHRTLRGFGWEKYSEPLLFAKKIGWTSLGIGLAWLGFGVSGMLVGHVAACGIGAVVAFWLISRRVALRDRLFGASGAVPRRELLSFNALNIVLVLLTMSLYHVDIVMLRLFVGNESTGHYRAALDLAEYLWFVPIGISAVYLHETSSLWSEGRVGAINDLASRTTRYTLLLTVLLALGLGALAGEVVPIYFGPSYVQATTPLRILLPGAIGFAVSYPLYQICRGHGNLKPVIAATGAAATINLVLNALLIPLFGMTGAAAATSVGYGSMFFLQVLAGRRLGFDAVADVRPVRLAVTALVSAVVIYGLPPLLGDGLLSLVVVPPVGLICFASVALAVGALDLSEAFDVLTSFPAPVGTASRRLRSHIEE